MYGDRLPHIFAYNLPGNLLAAWLRLSEAGVPEHNIRLVPTAGGFALPEVTLDGGYPEAPGPGNLGVVEQPGLDAYAPLQWCPRIRVNVDAQSRAEVLPDGRRNDYNRYAATAGRLALFVQPLLAGVPDRAADEPRRLDQDGNEVPHLPDTHPGFDPDVDPMERLAIELKERFKNDLMPALTPEEIGWMELLATDLSMVMTCKDTERPDRIRQLLRSTMDRHDRTTRGHTFRKFVFGLRYGRAARPNSLPPISTTDFLRWPDLLFAQPNYSRRKEVEQFAEEVAGSNGLREQHAHEAAQLRDALQWEDDDRCLDCIRELTELLTTETFKAVAMCDMLWGIRFIHGIASELSSKDDRIVLDGPVFSTTGGCDTRELLAILLRNWAKETAVLGIGPSAARGTGHGIDTSDLTDAQQNELWLLTAWRREAPDPIALLELAARRILDPNAKAWVRRYQPVIAQFDSLLGQLPGSTRRASANASGAVQQAGDHEIEGGTAILGGGLLMDPHVVLELSIKHDGGEHGKRYERIVAILQRLFVPVHLVVDVIWKGKPAALDGATYINHPVQREVWLSQPE